jgi:hypothetical protein
VNARRLVLAAVLAALACASGIALGALRGGDGGARAKSDPPAAATARLERRTLVERESVDGTLGYAGDRSVLHRGNAPATITWLPGAGSVVRPGGVLYRADDRPAILMDGAVPAYRRLAEGAARGEDVRQLERNLVALGHGAGVKVDDRFTAATTVAVKRLQRTLGVRRTGAVELGEVVFLRGARRVGERRTSLGASVAPGAEVLSTTSTRRVVEVELDVAKQGLVRRGSTVRVTLPDGTEIGGRVTSVGRAARVKGGGEGGEDGAGDGSGSEDEELVVDVTIALRSTRGARRLDGAPVSVDIARSVERDKLAAPVTALLARPGGGYALEVLDARGRRTVPVRTGFFADGYVEVSGRGLREGTRVVVPA